MSQTRSVWACLVSMALLTGCSDDEEHTSTDAGGPDSSPGDVLPGDSGLPDTLVRGETSLTDAPATLDTNVSETDALPIPDTGVIVTDAPATLDTGVIEADAPGTLDTGVMPTDALETPDTIILDTPATPGP